MITPNILPLVDRLAGRRVMIVGDVMLDHYTFGTVTRISPEAPVPVLQVSDEQYRLGGAGNVARNIVALGGQALIIGVIGSDQDGHVLTGLLKDAGVQTDLVQDDRRRTTRKTRIIAQNQQIVRVDREHTETLSKAVVGALLEKVAAHAQTHDIVVVSDYGKGVVTRALMDALRALTGPSRVRPRILVDPKPVNYDLYKDVDILTPNAKEASEGAGRSATGPDGPLPAAAELFKRLNCAQLLITLGAQGMALFEGPEKARLIPTFARKVFDVTGAGDTVIATLALALAAGADLLSAAVLANHAAGIVVAQVGAATASVEALREAINKNPDMHIEELRALA
ncbi:MAG: D-glycero-beta-D-manno-heptose-7-phosphate kinase [Proteobacteria bacterium]|nr:D-glycero-beta-D-manno-heptose-7-phosphate kinase [Pseudomonadota bacterium]MBU1594944.1 D-glycero-beta-D-manno-heptose-7-phosphate kinase [Pseudomonadota bacterium]